MVQAWMAKHRSRVHIQTPYVLLESIAALRHRLQPADPVEKVRFSAGLNSGTTTLGEPTHHIEWFLGSSLTFAALLLG